MAPAMSDKSTTTIPRPFLSCMASTILFAKCCVSLFMQYSFVGHKGNNKYRAESRERSFFTRFYEKKAGFCLCERKKQYLCSAKTKIVCTLGYGVMVTLQILVLPFLVRIRVAQQKKREVFASLFFCCRTSFFPPYLISTLLPSTI